MSRATACRHAVAAMLLAVLAGCGEHAAPPALAPAAPPTSAAVVPPPAAAPRVEPVVPPPAAPPRGVEHLPEQSAACLAQTAPPTAQRETTVHRWVDADGITHYADQPPPAGSKDHRVIAVHGLPPVTVEASGYDTNLPDQVQQRAVADALGVQRVLRDALGVAPPPVSVLHVVFVRDGDAYARLIGEPALAASAGAYSTAQRTIYVRTQAQEETSLAVLRHEITHALVHESIGNLPTPLNEGLAEYFGRYRAGGLGGQIDVGADAGALASAAPEGDGADALIDLVARDGTDFYAASAGAVREQRYLRAYALVALLMQDKPGRDTLAAVLAAQRAEPCRPVAVERVLDARYAGGLSALAAKWAQFMRAPSTAVQAY